MGDKVDLQLAAAYCDILRPCKDAFCKAVETKFNCTAIFHNLKESGSSANASEVSGLDLRYFIKLSSGLKVSVCKDDLTRYKVDAVVNAANEKLNHGGGLALALSVAGGPQIQRYSDQIIKEKGMVRTGQAVVTPSGLLPCNCIIHAVGPCLPPNPDQWHVTHATPLLRDTIRSILDIVIQEDILSVAIPALSSGLFNFPRHLCADIIVQTIKEYNDLNAFRNRKVEIHLVNNDEPTVQEMERACVQFLGFPTITGSYSGAVNSRDQSMTFSSGNSLQLGNLTLHLKQGLIQDQRVDVIVNTIAQNLDLSIGDISKAILNKAGKKIQEELNKSKTNYVTGGEIIETSGYNLNCLKVYHTVCRSRYETAAIQILYEVVLGCLKKAASAHTSISFPAIGTGNLCFDKHDVAQTMMDAVVKFVKIYPGKNLEVNFVVFPKDIEMMKAFENKLSSIKGRAKSQELSNEMPKSSAFGNTELTTNEIPTLEICSGTTEAMREAKVWTVNILNPKNGTITIMNNLVMHLGQKDHKNLLFLQTTFNVHIKVFFRSGSGGLSITGENASISGVAIQVEAMLCQAQENFALEEEADLLYSVVHWRRENNGRFPPIISAALEKAYLARKENVELHDCDVNVKDMYMINSRGKKSRVDRTCLLMDYSPPVGASRSFYARTPLHWKDYMEIERKVQACGLRIIRVEKIENAALQQIFKMNRKRVKDEPQILYQCVSAQFCDPVCRVGFQKDFAPPAEQNYGNGIYFTSTLDSALKLWNGLQEQYIYIIQAQVLTGKTTTGSPDLVLPPPIGSDPWVRYDSLTGMQNTHVIFSGQQALPEYLIICDKRGFGNF